MRVRQATWLRYVTVAVSTVTFFVPPSVLRAQDAVVEPHSAVVTDVTLADEGLLTVRAIDSAGNPAGGRNVRLLAHGAPVASVTTDSSGIFQVSGLREGLHEIEVDSASTSVRLWEEGAAPPHAEETACVVCPDPCQPACPPRNPPRPRRGPLQRAFANYPLATTALIGAGIGAAIAIPIAVSQRPASP
jgi:hypothetical protein